MDRPAPEEYQPRLTRWGHSWRMVLVVAISAVAWLPNVSHQPAMLRVLDVCAGAAAYLLVAFRRRWSLGVGILANLLSGVSAIAGGPAALAAVSVSTRRRWPEMALVGSASFAGGEFYAVSQPSSNGDSFWLFTTANAVVTGALLGWGLYIGSRRELMWTLRHRAERAEAEQEVRVAQGRATERGRIAREMHDVLAHRITQISMHAGAVAFREDLTAAEMRAHAALIEEKAHDALTDLRGVLGVLRDHEGELMHAPQPTYADLVGLVTEARESGLRVSYDDRVVDGPELPEVVGRTVYRIVQEGITNARKHAPGTLLSIELTGSRESGVDVTLRNPLGFGSTTPGSGLGLVGLAERAELRGGRLEHRRDESSFVLHGWIPWVA